MNIPYEHFQLENGLDVILHPDSRLPRVVVHLLYRIGARNDPKGRSGVAHLFEHLMFMGTKRVPEGRFDYLMEDAGGWNNAYTTYDATVYYDVGPSRLLSTLLWLEADRMATLAEALTPKKLDLQRDVVINEYRQSYENAPYGVAQLRLPELLFGDEHPYGRPIIGSIEDLRLTTVPDLRRLFARYYSPRNASLVVAGCFEPRRARALVERYFGWIPSAPAPRQPAQSPRPISEEIRVVMEDQVELPRLYMAWQAPALYTPGDAELDLAASILSEGRHSRLHRVLVHEKHLALDASAYQESRDIGSQFLVRVTAQQGVTLDELEEATWAVLDELRVAPPSPEELRRAQLSFETEYVERLERLRHRADQLNLYFARQGVADWSEADLARYRRVTVATMQAWVNRVLDPERRVVMQVAPVAR